MAKFENGALFLRDGRKKCLPKEWKVLMVSRHHKKRFELLCQKIDSQKPQKLKNYFSELKSGLLHTQTGNAGAQAVSDRKWVRQLI
jgi:hypothetical protein